MLEFEAVIAKMKQYSLGGGEVLLVLCNRAAKGGVICRQHRPQRLKASLLINDEGQPICRNSATTHVWHNWNRVLMVEGIFANN